jgi:hypothetical protein
MPTLYAARGGSSSSSLYTVNASTGAMTSVGATGYAITGLAVEPTTGTLYAVTSNNSPIHARALLTLDKATGAATYIGQLGLSSSSPIADIAFKSDGTLYGLSSAAVVYTINKSTGAATLVGSGASPGGFGMGFDIDAADKGYFWPNGTGDGEQFYEISDLTVGSDSAAVIGTGQNGEAIWGNAAIAAASFDASGVMWLAISNFGDPSGNSFATITSGGVYTDIGSAVANIDALAWDGGVKPDPWFVTGSGDFTISATPTSVTHTTPGSLTVEIDVGEVTDPATVTLTVDGSGLPAGVTASLDISTGTTPYSATLRLTAAAGALCAEGEVTVTGHATTTHSITITVTVSGTDGTYDKTGPAAGAQIGSSMSQTGADIIDGSMAVHQGDLYWTWTELTSGSGPYVAKWNGTDWDVIADESTFAPSGLSILPQLASDGENLFLAYATATSKTASDCRNPGSDLTLNQYTARCWKFDGAAWTHLGDIDPGPVINRAAADAASNTLELSASPDEVGACYVAFFSEGFEGGNAALYWFSRHLTVEGFGTSTLGSISFAGLLWNPPRDFGTGADAGKCVAPAEAGPEGFSMRLVGSGDKLALYSQAYDYHQFAAAYWSTINVWQPSGISTVTLATDFPSSDLPGTFVGYGPPVIVSENDVLSKRWVGVPTFTSFSSDFRIIRQVRTTTPTTFGHTFSVSDGSADEVTQINKLIGEPTNLWAVSQTSTGNVLLLTNRCGSTSWENDGGSSFPSGVPFSGRPVIFDDAIWISGSTGHTNVKAFRVPICRGCGTCCALASGFRGWQRF